MKVVFGDDDDDDDVQWTLHPFPLPKDNSHLFEWKNI